MTVSKRNNVQIIGSGPTTMVFAHGFGCDRDVWRLLSPDFASRFKLVLFDLVGSGPVVFVGHSVSAMIGVLAHVRAPERFTAHVMIAPSPCYIKDGDYVGGFTRQDIDALLDALEEDHLGWSSRMAPVVMGAPDRPELSASLTESFCRTNPDVAKHFARVTFLSDTRADVAKLTAPTLIIQSSDDVIAPLAVGEYLHRQLPYSTLQVIQNVGHCPHLSAPAACAEAMNGFLETL